MRLGFTDWIDYKNEVRSILVKISEKYFNERGFITEDFEKNDTCSFKYNFPVPNVVLKIKNGVYTKKIGVAYTDGFYTIIFDYDNLWCFGEENVPLHMLKERIEFLVQDVLGARKE